MKNIIGLKGGDHTDIRKAFDQWIGLYSDALQAGLSFELYKKSPDTFVIKAGDALSDEHFSYLLNYLVYPENIDNKAEITGYTTITDKNFFPKKMIGENILVYIPKDDAEYDVVYWVTKDNKVYKTDVGGKTIEPGLSKIYQEFIFDPNEYDTPEIVKIK